MTALSLAQVLYAGDYVRLHETSPKIKYALSITLVETSYYEVSTFFFGDVYGKINQTQVRYCHAHDRLEHVCSPS